MIAVPQKYYIPKEVKIYPLENVAGRCNHTALLTRERNASVSLLRSGKALMFVHIYLKVRN